MTTNDITRLSEIFVSMEQLLEQYNDIAAVILRTESEEIELLTEKIAERQRLIDETEALRSEATSILDSVDKREAELIRNMLTGGTINQRIVDDRICKAVVNLRSAQMKASESDIALQRQFESRLVEARENLKQLNDDKKKLDYYSSLNQKGITLGGSLDSSY